MKSCSWRFVQSDARLPPRDSNVVGSNPPCNHRIRIVGCHRWLEDLGTLAPELLVSRARHPCRSPVDVVPPGGTCMDSEVTLQTLYAGGPSRSGGVSSS